MQSPEFPLPPATRKHKGSAETTCTTIHVAQWYSNTSDNDEQRAAYHNSDYMRKQIARERESEDQRNARLNAQRKRSVSNRSNENEDQRNTRLYAQRKRSASIE